MTRVLISGLSKVFPGSVSPALDRLTLDIGIGELVALLGPSGCGKTTALRIIAGLLAPSSGDVTFDGRSIIEQKPEDRGAVMVFQNHLLFPHMSVAENVGFGLRMRGVGLSEIKRRVGDMLAMVKLPELGMRKPSELSGGQQQRVALARALIVAPRVLLLDEPLSNLDASLRQEMRELVRSLQRELRITTVFVTHDQEDAVVLADRVALLLNGALRQYAEPESFYQRPADEEVARFFGGRNFIAGQSVGGRFTSALGTLVLPEGVREGSGTLTFRPESVRIGAAPVNTLTAKLVGRRFLGIQMRLRLQVGEQDLEALVSPANAVDLNPGADVTINLPPAALWIVASR